MPEPIRDAELLGRIFDAYPAPTLLVDGALEVLHANRAAAEDFGSEGVPDPAESVRGGELMRCANVVEGGGCGRSTACKRCIVRGSVERAFACGAVRRAHAFMQLRRAGRLEEVHFLVSAAPVAHGGSALAVVTLEDVSELVHLRGLLPICAGCRKIRDEENYWRTVEDYFKRHLDIDFSHGFCDACVERLCPEIAARRGGGQGSP